MYIGPSQKFASSAVFREGYTLSEAKADQDFVRNAPNRATIKKRLNGVSPLFEGDEIIEYPCDQSTTTRRYFDKAIEFVGQNKEKPFFVYITPSMPHIPLFASEQFRGKSKRGLYGDVVEEIDWNVGRFLDYLDQQGLAENTLVIFASDNGPWLGYKEDSGSADPLRGGGFHRHLPGRQAQAALRHKGRLRAGLLQRPRLRGLPPGEGIAHPVPGCERPVGVRPSETPLRVCGGQDPRVGKGGISRRLDRWL